MNSQDASASELPRLLDGLLDGSLTDADYAQLSRTLSADPAARRYYCRYLALHALLLGEHAKPLELSGLLGESCPVPQMPTIAVPLQSATSSPITLPPRTPVLGFLASLGRHVPGGEFTVGGLLLLVIVAAFWGLSQAIMYPKLGGRDLAANSEPVATIRETAEVEWSSNESEISNLKSQIVAGQPLSIHAGLVELKLKRGVTLIVEGPAAWMIDGDNNATLTRGKLVARVSREGVGFTLATPSAEVVDLGTEFAVDVSEQGDTDVHVIQGKVDLYRAEGDSSPKRGSKTARRFPPKGLVAGQAARVEVATPSSATIQFRPEKFARSVDAAREQRKSRPTRLLDLSKAAVEQSSTWLEDVGNFSASAALDGVPESVSHTTGDAPGQWWQVDLGQTFDVVAVELNNRPIRCGWLRDISVKILGEDGKTVLYESELLNPNNEAYGGAKEFEGGPAQLMLDVHRTHGKPVRGRFIRLERVACEATAELAPQDTRPAVVAAAGKAIVLSEVKVFVERD